MQRTYLDHNASAPLRPEAAEALARALALPGNPSSVHAEGRAAHAVLERARESAVAEGQAEAIRTVYGAIHTGDPTPDLLAIKYFEALAAVADGRATKIFLPTEMGGLFGTIGGLAELFQQARPDAAAAATESSPPLPPSA